MVLIDSRQFWLYAAADPQMNGLCHLRLFSALTYALNEMLLHQPR